MSFAKHSGRVVVTCFRPFTILLVLAGILKTEVDSSHDVVLFPKAKHCTYH